MTSATPNRPLRDAIPLWVIAAIAALILMMIFFSASYALNRNSDPTFSAILGLKVPPPAPVAKPVEVVKAPDRLQRHLVDEIREGKLTVRDLSDRSVVLAQGDALFEPGSANLSPSFAALLTKVGAAVAQVGGKVLVRGHSDNQPIRSARFPSNWHLSQARADAVAAAIAPQLQGQKIQTEGRADSEPLATNATPDGRAQNRRVEIIVFPTVGTN